jgi:outer membrane receptor protein involved in Fe transport
MALTHKWTISAALGAAMQVTSLLSTGALMSWPAQPTMAADQETAPGGGARLEEIIVTAQKRSERLQDVPVPVTALSAITLAERSQTRLQDYFADVPGLNLTSSGTGQMNLSIRGLTTGSAGGGGATVGVTIDDVPRGANTAPGFSSTLYEDLDPSDLDRIEVLRGPQGTLYGASSIGGLIKFVTVDPSTSGFKGRAQLSIDDTRGSLGYGVRGAVNLPISNDLAVRVSGFTRRDPGYVDNVTTGQNNINQVQVKGGRASALWRPSDNFSIKLAAMLQNTDGDGSAEVDEQLGGLRQARMRGTEVHSQKSELYSGVLNASFAGINLTSTSGYGTYKYSHLSDQTAFYGDFAHGLGASLLDRIETKKFTQEIRLASAIPQSVDWLLGVFYTHEDTPAHQSVLANDYNTGVATGSQAEIDFPTSFSEQAAFGDITVHFGDQFNVQVGGRVSTNRQRYDEVDSGSLFGGTFVTPTTHTKADANTFLVSPQYKISPDLMTYIRVASGYRAGGPNANVPGGSAGLPTSYQPDKDTSFDLGLKGEVLDHRLSFDLAAYRIAWKNVQIVVIDQNYLLHTNGGDAKSQGLELSGQARPTERLTIAASATFGDATLTDALPATASAIGRAGDRLPFSSRFAASVSADQEFGLNGFWIGTVGAAVRYVGDREGDFTTSPTTGRVDLPAYTQFDLRGGARRDSWNINVFVNNLSDKRGVVGRGVGGSASLQSTAVYIQPRTLGLSVAKEF